MTEIRIDPLSGLRAIIATGAATPSFEVAAGVPIDPDCDPLAEGHEDRTAPELYARRPGGGEPDTPGWSVRVVPSSVSTLSADAAEPPAQEDPEVFRALAARGAHEVVVNAPQPVSSLAELAVEQVCEAVDVWRERMRAHADAAYVHVCISERAEAGAAYAHTHAELHALDFVPGDVARERERFSAHAVRTMGSNLLEDLVQHEVRRRERIVAIDDEAVLMCPYASRHPFALMLAPRRRRERFEDDGPTGAALLHHGLSLLRARFARARR